jgi:hypothetical protein
MIDVYSCNNSYDIISSFALIIVIKCLYYHYFNPFLLYVYSIHREAKKTLPRPKVGDFCTIAMEQGFKDACTMLCTGNKPVPRIAQACRAAAIEMPRPTVRKWCEHGYRQGYSKTVDSLKTYFLESVAVEDVESSVLDEVRKPIDLQRSEEAQSEVHTPAVIIKSVPITLDEEVLTLDIHEGQSPEDAVASFCSLHMTDDISGCIRQLLPNVLEVMN